MASKKLDSSIKTWAILCHLSGLVGLIISPCNFLFPLIIWSLKKSENEFIAAHGRSAMNFQLSWIIYNTILIIVFVFLFITTCGYSVTIPQSGNNILELILNGALLVFLCLLVLSLVLQLALVTYACYRASKGEFYKYPFTIEFFR